MARIRGVGGLLEQYLQGLPAEQQAEVGSLVVVLVDEVRARPGMERRVFGERQALEVVWAIGRYLNSPLARRLEGYEE